MLRVLTDFNEIDARNMVSALESRIEGEGNLRVGNRMLLYDGGEHEAWGRIASLADGLMEAELDWSTWGPAGRYYVEQYGGWNVGQLYSVPSPVGYGVLDRWNDEPAADLPAVLVAAG